MNYSEPFVNPSAKKFYRIHDLLSKPIIPLAITCFIAFFIVYEIKAVPENVKIGLMFAGIGLLLSIPLFFFFGLLILLSLLKKWDQILAPALRDFYGLELNQKTEPVSLEYLVDFFKPLQQLESLEELEIDTTPEISAVHYTPTLIPDSVQERELLVKAQMLQAWTIPLYPEAKSGPRFGTLGVDRANRGILENGKLEKHFAFSSSGLEIPSMMVRSPYTGIETRVPVNPKILMLMAMRHFGWKPRRGMVKGLMY
ncbi:hypothetical protein BSR29_00895 [Boudabousia liubingyangii]|uniref:Uncharacterized protein n=1 Tax=Boudabousia liubingyangii TaxID=1921764 RepID=A0A1Q5PPU8_9ACTO|nr:hypothetical protein [Boudabousia liubingyangii]OKL49546.1 hypothetical protein BSR29_00895 [Boudabousia liubingyangii]